MPPSAEALPEGNPRNARDMAAYALSGMLYRARLAGRLRARSPIVVFQMGKVGSSSIVEALRTAGDTPVFHVHSLTAEGLAYLRRFDELRGRSPGEHYWSGEFLRRRLARGTVRPQVVSVVRDPVARNVSAWFQALDLWDPAAWSRPDAADVEAVATRFLEHYPHERVFEWFELELGQGLGVDILAHPFDRARGSARITAAQAELLLLRLEDFDSSKPEAALQAFLGFEAVTLPTANKGRAKRQGALYHRFLQDVRLPEEYLDRLYGHPVSQHFYAAAELDAFRARWGSR